MSRSNGGPPAAIGSHAAEQGYWPVPCGLVDPLDPKPKARVIHACFRRQDAPFAEYDAEKLAEEASLEKFVTGDTPPAFLWHTREDGSVPPENSLLLASELCRKGVAFELHIWQRGAHGMSLGNDQVYPPDDPNIHPECQEWIDMAARWLKALNER